MDLLEMWQGFLAFIAFGVFGFLVNRAFEAEGLEKDIRELEAKVSKLEGELNRWHRIGLELPSPLPRDKAFLQTSVDREWAIKNLGVLIAEEERA